ncbi:hypothetical protein OSSY52_22380 [Tepiditoga spiralis]|uniref:Uncharacterized protein n=1 Tax=Tepiditoga spiralis TaxID=2108365 RepID=A0A7G1GAE7_9BACT|nr:hypothetical protein [Tepiditoga spiralis]BBE32097.1 hypothetical protein OSSY52_22380 [Tepiditoga spiralis]
MKKIHTKFLFFIFILISIYSFSFENFIEEWRYENRNINDNKIVASLMAKDTYIFFENVEQTQNMNIITFSKEGKKIKEVKLNDFLLINVEKKENGYVLFGKYNFEGKNYASIYLLNNELNIIKKNYYFIDGYTPIKMLYKENNIVVFCDKYDGKNSIFKEIIYDEMLNEKSTFENIEKGFIKINDVDTYNDTFYITGWKDNTDSKLDMYISVRTIENKVLWTKTFGGKSDDKGYKIKIYDNSIIIGGTNESYNEKNNKDIWILRLSNEGNIIWSKLYDSGFLDEINDIKIKDQKIYITGYSITTKNDEDSYILKLNLKGEKDYLDLSNFLGTDIGNSLIIDDKKLILSGFFVSSKNSEETTGIDSLIILLNRK